MQCTTNIYTGNWFHYKCFLPVFREFLKPLGDRLSVVEPLFNEVTRNIFAVQLFRKIYHVQVALLEIS